MTPELWALLLIAVPVAYMLGTYRQAAKAAHHRFASYRHRMTGGFTVWIKNLAMYALMLAGVGVALAALYVLIR
ncbi:hypothetical protein ACIBO2_57960 [Nonomuraea sp. NPDC050022]|uniref:hypothetical protein n=1 Tax=Nonomuraea sp. NPDC050022 TaxID=3364358 RepID=UPI003787F230